MKTEVQRKFRRIEHPGIAGPVYGLSGLIWLHNHLKQHPEDRIPMSPSKLPKMALSHHERYSSRFSPSEGSARCPDPTRKEKGRGWPAVARFGAFLSREWKELRSLVRYWRLKREGEAIMRTYVNVAEAMGYSVMSAPPSKEQQQRLVRVHQIRAEMIAIRWRHL